MSNDYKNGYRDGFLDGFKAAKDNPYMTNPVVPNPYVSPTYPTIPTSMPKSCSECGRSFVDSMGRPTVMAIVCANIKCPSTGSCIPV